MKKDKSIKCNHDWVEAWRVRLTPSCVRVVYVCSKCLRDTVEKIRDIEQP